MRSHSLLTDVVWVWFIPEGSGVGGLVLSVVVFKALGPLRGSTWRVLRSLGNLPLRRNTVLLD